MCQPEKTNRFNSNRCYEVICQKCSIEIVLFNGMVCFKVINLNENCHQFESHNSKLKWQTRFHWSNAKSIKSSIFKMFRYVIQWYQNCVPE